jgi:hypothetical protein
MTDRVNGRVSGRRLLAAVGLLAVLVAAVVVALAGKTYTGTPVAAPPPPPPQVGDCVLDPITPPWVAAVEQGDASTYHYQAVTTGPCTGDRYGEVAGMIADPVAPVVTADSVEDANQGRCQTLAASYLGVSVDAANGSGPPNTLQVALWVSSSVTGPSPRQQAAGQHWLACLTYLQPRPSPDTPLDPRRIPEQELYSSSLRNAVSTGHEKDRTALCTASPLEQQGWVATCTRQHTGEVFARGAIGAEPASRPTLHTQCAQLVARQTTIPDLAAAGLTVELAAVDNDGSPTDTDPIPPYSQLYCGLSAANRRLLVGSLLHLGDHPIPWAS